MKNPDKILEYAERRIKERQTFTKKFVTALVRIALREQEEWFMTNYQLKK